MSDKEIIDYWGNSLVKIDPSLLENSGLPAATKIFLQEIGVPEIIQVFQQLTPWLIMRKPDAFEAIINDDKKYIIVGDIMHRSLVGIEVESAHVLIFNHRGYTEFINANLRLLLLFIVIYRNFTANLSERKLPEEFLILKQKLMDLDNLAFTQDIAMWKLITDELELAIEV